MRNWLAAESGWLAFSPVAAEQTVPRSRGLKQSLAQSHGSGVRAGLSAGLAFVSSFWVARLQLEGPRWRSGLGPRCWLLAGASSFLRMATSLLLAPPSLGPVSPWPLSVVQHPDFFMWLRPASANVEAVWPCQPQRSLPPHSVSRNKS